MEIKVRDWWRRYLAQHHPDKANPPSGKEIAVFQLSQ
jgi:hypothetical protein|tara:strand:+ start:3661 stop:3771 length:111 start_codon:yes stop_codon:yes gene_type:complete